MQRATRASSSFVCFCFFRFCATDRDCTCRTMHHHLPGNHVNLDSLIQNFTHAGKTWDYDTCIPMLYSQMFAHQNCLLENTMLGFVKALPLILALAILGLFTASCNSSNNAHVRFVNAIADTEDYGNTGLDIDFNGTKEFTDVAFSGIQPTSGYTPVPSGSVTVNGLETGGTNVIFSLPGVDLSSGTDYTLVSTGNVLETNVKIISPADNNTAPANGSVNFRVINASP